MGIACWETEMLANREYEKFLDELNEMFREDELEDDPLWIKEAKDVPKS